jgi:hypothetical protein
MPPRFWIRRFVVVFVGAFAVLLAAGLLRQRSWGRAAGESALWAGIAAAIFVTTRILRSRRGEYCELCGDDPAGGAGKACQRPLDKPER